MASIASLEKIEIIRSEEFMLSEARLKFLKKMIILGPKTAILGPQFCRILVLGPQFWWSGGAWAPPDPPLSSWGQLLLIVQALAPTSAAVVRSVVVYDSMVQCITSVRRIRE